jgi:hypothetical protein
MREPPDTAPEGQACYTGMGDDTRRGGQAEGLGRTIQVS